MKKFCDKITSKQQWRVTVPNLSGSIFKKSSSTGKCSENNGLSPTSSLNVNQLIKRRSCGSYDLQAAALEYEEKSRSAIIGGAVLESSAELYYSNESESDSYQDAVENCEKSDGAVSSDYLNVYADVDVPRSPMSAISRFDDDDVPKISFSFFDEHDDHNYQLVKVSQNEGEEKKTDVQNEDVIEKPKHMSGVALTLMQPISLGAIKRIDSKKLSKSEADICRVKNSNLRPLKIDENVDRRKFYTSISSSMGMKSNSDPNLSISQIEVYDHDEEHLDDDGLYKVPTGPARLCKRSRSLADINGNSDAISSAHSSIEHISCSQVINPYFFDVPLKDSTNTISNDKERQSLNSSVRNRVFRFSKRNARAWSNLRSKLNRLVVEQAATQRVGYFSEKDKSVLKIEQAYKSSKDRCKKMWKVTGKKLFSLSLTNQENVDPSDSASQIVKNDAFFANVSSTKKLCVNDIEHPVCSENGVNEEQAQGDNGEEASGDIQLVHRINKGNKLLREGQSGFDDLRKFVKQSGDFCKELSGILQERSEAEIQYAKSLQKLSTKLARACREGSGTINDAWCSVAIEMETQAEAHKLLGNALLEDTVRPLKNLTENQHKIRKQAEVVVDKTTKALAEWRASEAKSKKNSHACARENEKMQDALSDVRLSKTSSIIHMHNQKVISEKENTKMETKRRKAEEAMKKSDVEYYTLCVRAERARLEWESAVLKGSNTFQTLEEERLNNLKSTVTSYLHHIKQLGPRIIETSERLACPIIQAEPNKDLITFTALKNTTQQPPEQLLPDFYCEHITLAMNRDRRKLALVKLLQLIRQDIERERKSKEGLKNLSNAIKHTPSFGAEDSHQNVNEKILHMTAMLTYLEAARYKIQSSLAELDSRPRSGHPLAPHITVTRDKSGLQHSVLKVPNWLTEDWNEPESPLSQKSVKSDRACDADMVDSDWTDRGTADGNSNQPDSDFDEFSSQGSSAECVSKMEDSSTVTPVDFCRALYRYTPNLTDELHLEPGDVISIYKKSDDGWFLGECNGAVGIFPSTYVEFVKN